MVPGKLIDPLVDSEAGWTTIDQEPDEDQDLLEPIAVIGFALKFPQDATSPAEFWKMMEDKVNAMTEIPPNRFDINTLYKPSNWSSLSLRGGHLLKQDLGGFDAEFFEISPSEAIAMDPAQRILLETTYHAFENAGLRLEDLRGSNTSVHTGCFTADYLHQLLSDPECSPMYSAIGGTLSMLANRVSWFYDLTGPSVNLDSACSSSAMALDQACQALRSGEADMGVVAGCNLTIDPNFTKVLSNMQFLSTDSRSYSFDSRANGYARGEGVGVVLLQPLSKALHKRNNIRAIIRSSGANQDGRTATITQPNSKAQMQLIRNTYRKAGLSMKHTRFFEAHGTGTVVGDPAETCAIAEVFEEYRNTHAPLYVGALKSNIGHLEGASGIAALIKTVLVLEKGIIPPNANFISLNSRISQLDSCLAFPSSCIPWPSSRSGIRRASINCFGYGGSNCHLIVDDALSFLNRRGLQGQHQTSLLGLELSQQASLLKIASPPTAQATHRDNNLEFPHPKILVWSAATDVALASVIDAWQKYYLDNSMQSTSDFDVEDFVYTLDTRRSRMAWRSYAIVHSLKELDTLASKASTQIKCLGQSPRPAFIFTGQGAQWFAMGRELFQYKLFSEVIDEAETTLKGFGCIWSVKQEFFRSEKESRIHEPQYAQPLCAILQIALVDLLQAAGVVPCAVVGHSMGEIAAAYCTGALSRRSAFKLAYYRGAFFAKIPERSSVDSGMLAVGLSVASIQPYLERVKSVTARFNLHLACINSPENVTVSGELAQLRLLEDELQVSSTFFRKLRVNAAYHSSQLNCIAQDCLQHIGLLESGWSQRYIPMISTVSAALVSPKELRDSRYWIKNMLSPVDFSGAIQYLCTSKEITVDRLIELGPHATLRLPVHEIFQHLPDSRNFAYDSVLHRKKPASDSLLQTLGNLFCLGYPVNLRSINNPDQAYIQALRVLSDGPEYPFCHAKTYWYESQLTHNQRFKKHKHNPLLGDLVPDYNPLRPQWRYRIRSAELPWLRDHRLGKRTVYPASALISMALAAASQMADPIRPIRAYVVRQVCFRSPVAPPLDSDDMETRLSMSPLDITTCSSNWIWQFAIFVSHGRDYSEACTGIVEIVYDQDISAQAAVLREYQTRLSNAKLRCNNEVSSLSVYKVLERMGYQYGPSFRGMQTVQHNCDDLANTAINLALPNELDTDHRDYIIHPASLDSFVQLCLVPLTSGLGKDVSLHVPTSLEKLWISGNSLNTGHEKLQASVKLEKRSHHASTYSLFALHEQENSMQLIMNGLETSAIDSSRSERDQQLLAIDNTFNIRTIVDVEMLTPAEIHEWLDQECGPDAQGLAQFLEELRAYIANLLSELQSEYRNFTEFPHDRAHLSRYLDWINWQMTRDALHRSLPSNFRDSESLISTQGPVGKLMIEVGRNIRNVLDGRTDALELLFENDLMKDFYQNQAFGSVYEAKFKTFVRQLALKRPRMDILEIGGGTGSFTRHMLQALEANTKQQHLYNQYTFTDISPIFFEKAKQEFSAHESRMIFKKLDIGIDLAEQDYQETQYDLIVASNVLHVTSDLSAAIRAVRKLLRPGGKLLLHETVVPDNLETGFAFGLIQGWWCGAEAYRSMSPLVTEDRWISLLCENGFAPPDLILRDFSDDDSHHMDIMCASAIEEVDPPRSSTHITIVGDVDSSSEIALASMVHNTLMNNNMASSIMTLTEVFQRGPFETVVFLVDVIQPFFPQLNEDSFEALKAILASAKRVLWVTGGGDDQADPAFGMVSGFSRVLRIEFPQLDITSLGLSKKLDGIGTTNQDAQCIAKVLGRLESSRDRFNLEDYIFREGKLTIQRTDIDEPIIRKISDLLEHKTTEIRTIESARPFTVSAEQCGEDDGIEIVAEQANEYLLPDDEVEIEVHAVGLNQADMHVHQGMTSHRALGTQGAGIVKVVGSSLSLQIGDRVCFWYRGALRSKVRVKVDMVARLPGRIPFSEAAALPNNYLCASLLVNVRIRLRSDGSILVLARNNSLTLAIIDKALEITPSVYAAVFEEEDKKILERLYLGQVSVHSIQGGLEELQCRQKRFDAILDLSNKPVQLDIFANVSKYGQVIRVEGPIKSMDMFQSMPRIPADISFHITTIESILADQIEQNNLSLWRAVRSYFGMKSYLTSKDRVFNLSEVSKALDYLRTNLASNAVIELDDSQKIRVTSDFEPGYDFTPNATYIIAGGFGDLGRCLAKWMVARGAKNLILFSRSGPCTPAARQMIQDFEEKSVIVQALQCDITDSESLKSTLEVCMQTMPTIKGCIQASGVLKVRFTASRTRSEADLKSQDVMYLNMTLDDWKAVVGPKTQGSWNLHELLPPGMDFFILISSVIGIVGQATQINYAAANSYEDALARYRVARGEKALSLDLGALLTGGLLSQNPAVLERISGSGHHIPMSEPEILNLMEICCDPSFQRGSELAPQIVSGVRSPTGCIARGIPIMDSMKYPSWSQLHPVKSTSKDTNSDSEAANAFELLKAAKSPAAAKQVAANSIVQRLATIMAIEAANIQPEQTLLSNNVDSLCVIELRNWIIKVFGIEIPMFDLLGGSTIAEVGLVIANKWREDR